MENSKFYKHCSGDNNRIFPGDPSGLPDALFFLELGGFE